MYMCMEHLEDWLKSKSTGPLAGEDKLRVKCNQTLSFEDGYLWAADQNCHYLVPFFGTNQL